MKIAIAARDARSLSGVSGVVRALAEGAGRAGHKVLLVSCRPPQGTLHGVRSARVAVVPFTSLSRAWSFDVAARWRARRFSPDVLHGHGDLTSQDVLTVNNVDAAEARHAGRATVGSPGTLFVRRRQFLPGAARRIVTVSERAKADLAAFYGVEPSRVRVIRLGVDSERFRPAARPADRQVLRSELALPEDSRLFLCLISGDAQRRNTRGLVDAFAAARLGAKDALVIVGDPDAVLAPGARRLLAEDRLRLMAKTSAPERIYRACDFFVLPAHYETFGMTVLEAMASGLPVVVTAACGASELIVDQDNGLVVADSRDQAAIGRALERLASSPDLARRLAARGLETARRMTWRSAVDGYLDLYGEVAEEKRRG